MLLKRYLTHQSMYMDKFIKNTYSSLENIGSPFSYEKGPRPFQNKALESKNKAVNSTIGVY